MAKPRKETKPDSPAHPCPLCAGGQGGKGREYSRRGPTIYLKCDTCGHTWTKTPTPAGVEVSYRTTEIETRGPADGEKTEDAQQI